MTTISPTKRRILGSLNPNASPCPGSKPEFDAGQLEVQATESSVLPAGYDKDREEEPARKRVCLERDHRGAQRHQQIEADGHRRNQSRSTSPPTESRVLFGKSTTNVSQSTTTVIPAEMEHERERSLSVLPALHPTRVAAEGAAFSAPMATQIAYPAGLVENFHNHKQPKRTNNPRLRLANQAARQKAEIIRLRLSLAAYKIQTGQTDVPLEQLEVRSLLPPGAYHHSQRRLADGASSEAAVDNYHDGSNINPASWSFSSSSTNSSSQGTGYVQRVNHLRHAAGAAIEAVQAKQERRTAWGREREQQYREWYEQYRHRDHQGSTWDHAAEQKNHDGFSRDQNRQRQPQHEPQQQRRQRQQRTNLGSGRKPLPDRRARESWSGSTSTGGTAAIGTATTAAATTSPHLNRLDLAERALQAHQRLQSRAVTEELPMEHEHEHDEIDSEQNSLQLTHHHHHHQPQQQQQRRQYMDHDRNGWVVHPTTENVPEVADDIGEGPGRGDLDDEEEEEIAPSRSRSQMVGSGSGYSTEPEPEPGLPSLSPFQSHAAASVEHEDQGEGVDEEEGEEEEEQGEDGDEAASGLLSLSRG
ncbi:hypothetical protein B0H65DRAFT_472589 [Neurospora tetraspora]|uniref:Uncharacterized protein n=1 Tax=Neurospora tetraspora TaxID=94610 RepID=A0AAE0JBY2_9PEZI|nr:hypothetical protein B0H65DRAFT_472589 [Neurospora tetraspora]